MGWGDVVQGYYESDDRRVARAICSVLREGDGEALPDGLLRAAVARFIGLDPKRYSTEGAIHQRFDKMGGVWVQFRDGERER